MFHWSLWHRCLETWHNQVIVTPCTSHSLVFSSSVSESWESDHKALLTFTTLDAGRWGCVLGGGGEINGQYLRRASCPLTWQIFLKYSSRGRRLYLYTKCWWFGRTFMVILKRLLRAFLTLVPYSCVRYCQGCEKIRQSFFWVLATWNSIHRIKNSSVYDLFYLCSFFQKSRGGNIYW
jgi:hypothetical protein